jgi:HSP20 family protein
VNLEKLAPWNWFKKEEEQEGEIVPIKHDSSKHTLPSSVHDLHTEFDRLFDSIKQRFDVGFSRDFLSTADWLKPSLDIASDGKEYSIKVELPGIEASDINIEITDNTIKIKGEKHQEKEEKEKNYYRIERSYGSFQRILDIPEDADTDKITSNYKDGVLTVSVPRKMLPQKDTKKIEVKVK